MTDFPRYPEKIMIQTTSRCNAACAFCPYPALSRFQPGGRMSDRLFMKIVEDAALNADRVDTIMPFLMNEPLLDPDLVRKIRFIKRTVPRTGVHLLTNGSLLDEATGGALIDSPIDWVGISFFSISPKHYRESMGLPFERVLKRVERFVRKALARRGAGFVMITFFKWDGIDDRIAREALEYWRALGVTRLVCHESGISRAGNVSGIDAPEKKNMNRCDSIWTERMLHVLWNGDVVPCCMDWRRRHVLGNLNRQSVRETWNAAPYREFRRVLRGLAPIESAICSRCEMAVFE